MNARDKTGLIEIAPKVWAWITSIVGPNGGGPNAGFLLAGDRLIVVDALISPPAALELKAAALKATGKEPALLINTHGHGDHVIGNSVFSPPAAIIAHENAREAVLREGRGIIDHAGRLHPEIIGDLKDASIMPPEITYGGGMALHFGDRTVELVHPGKAHTTGDTFVLLRKEKVLFAGDLVFNHHIPTIFGDSAGWIAALEMVEGLGVRTIVPGHGLLCTTKELTELKNCLVSLRWQTKECYDLGLTGEQALSRIDMGEFRTWQHQERLARDIDQVYKELATGAK